MKRNAVHPQTRRNPRKRGKEDKPMFHKVLEGTGFVLVQIGAMAINECNPWYVPVGFFLLGALLMLWGAWEEGILQRWLRERGALR